MLQESKLPAAQGTAELDPLGSCPYGHGCRTELAALEGHLSESTTALHPPKEVVEQGRQATVMAVQGPAAKTERKRGKCVAGGSRVVCHGRNRGLLSVCVEIGLGKPRRWWS